MTQSFESSCLGITLPWGTPAHPGSRAGLGEAIGGVVYAPCHCRIRNYSTPWGFQVRLTTPSPAASVCGPGSLCPRGGRISVELGLCTGCDVTHRLLPESPPEAKQVDFGPRNPFTDGLVIFPHMGLTNHPFQAEDHARGGFRPHVLGPSRTTVLGQPLAVDVV